MSALPTACIFCEILAGTRPVHVVHDDARTLAFLDHRPLFPGHVLVVPREHRETLWDLPEDALAPVFASARLVARAVVEGLPCHGVFVAVNNVVSQSVPHLHVHVIPRRRGDGLKGFFWPRHSYKDEAEMLRTRDAIKTAVERLKKS